MPGGRARMLWPPVAMGAPHSKLLAQVGGGHLGRAPHIEGRNEPPLLVHQINDCRVVHRVVATVDRHLPVVDTIGLRHRRQGGGIAGEPTYMRIEARQVIFHGLWGVALRIDRNEQRRCPVRFRPKIAHDLGHLEKGGRAYVRAMREPEENQEGLTLEVLVAKRLTVLIDQAERTANGGGLDGPGFAEATAHKHNDAEAEREPRDECREYHYRPRRSFPHRPILVVRRFPPPLLETVCKTGHDHLEEYGTAVVDPQQDAGSHERPDDRCARPDGRPGTPWQR